MAFWLKIYNDIENIPRKRSKSSRGCVKPIFTYINAQLSDEARASDFLFAKSLTRPS